MLTKEECEMALKNIALSYDAEYVNECNDEFCQAMKNYIKMLENLIEEHFYNPPLKFEELKENMWIWDNNWNQYFEICEIYPQTKEFDVLIHQNRINKLRYEPMKFEPNRFYRKEVQE